MLQRDQLGAVHQQAKDPIEQLRVETVADVAEDHGVDAGAARRALKRREVLAKAVADDQLDELVLVLFAVAQGHRRRRQDLLHGGLEAELLQVLGDLAARARGRVRDQPQTAAEAAQLLECLVRAVDRLVADVQHAVDIEQHAK